MVDVPVEIHSGGILEGAMLKGHVESRDGGVWQMCLSMVHSVGVCQACLSMVHVGGA